jgi:hypothetical protein
MFASLAAEFILRVLRLKPTAYPNNQISSTKKRLTSLLRTNFSFTVSERLRTFA